MRGPVIRQEKAGDDTVHLFFPKQGLEIELSLEQKDAR